MMGVVRVLIGVEGGVVQWVQADSEHVRVLVKDYDVEGCTQDEMHADRNGEGVHFCEHEVELAVEQVEEDYAMARDAEIREEVTT